MFTNVFYVWPTSDRGARVSACAGVINQLQSCGSSLALLGKTLTHQL